MGSKLDAVLFLARFSSYGNLKLISEKSVRRFITCHERILSIKSYWFKQTLYFICISKYFSEHGDLSMENTSLFVDVIPLFTFFSPETCYLLQD